MAKKARKKVAAKAKKPAKSAAKRKGVVAKARTKARAKPRRKAAPAKKAKPVAKQPIVAQQPAPPPRRNFIQRIEQKIEGAVEAVRDTLTDAERLHRKLDPGISQNPE